MDTKRAVVAGHICLDITPVFPPTKVGGIGQLLQPGKLIQMQAAEVSTGGAVANTGRAMERLGANVTLLTKLGDDAFGGIMKKLLGKAGENIPLLPGESTSYTVVLAVPGQDRIFLHDPGANNTFCAEDVPQETLDGAALFHFGYPPLMKRMYENGGDELVKILQKAHAAGAATSLDLAAVDPDSEAGAADWEAILTRVLPQVDFFVPSVEELCFMLDRPRYDKWQNLDCEITEHLDLNRDIRPLAERCIALGAKVVLLKCGAPGLYCCAADAETLGKIPARLALHPALWAGWDAFEPSYQPERILSGTGAGDTSIAAFLAALLEGCGPGECVQLAAAAGASCVAVYDALSGIPSMAELRRKIAAGWKKGEAMV